MRLIQVEMLLYSMLNSELENPSVNQVFYGRLSRILSNQFQLRLVHSCRKSKAAVSGLELKEQVF